MNRANRNNGEGVVGTTLGGKYHLVSVIGHGGMGIVCEARHVSLGKRFAIKIINKAVPRPDIIAARFRREVRAISAIESENIVQVFDVGVDDKLGLYMVMEFLPGEDLSARLAREKKIEPTEVALLGYQIARGLAKAHASRIIHRDLKPANIFLIKRDDGSEQVKLLDFGVSKLLDGEASDTWVGNLTTIGMSVGTPQYMSPEQAQGHELDEGTDVWSLGVVLYEMLSGVPAYAAQARAHQTIVRVVTERPTPLSEIAPWVSPRLASIVHSALQHDRKLRIPNCKHFADLLAECTESDASYDENVTAIGHHPLGKQLPAVPQSSPRSASPGSSPSSNPTGLVHVHDTSMPIPIVRKPSRVSWWPAVLVLTAAVLVTGHVGATRGSNPCAASEPGDASMLRTEPVAAAAPAPAVRRTEFVSPTGR